MLLNFDYAERTKLCHESYHQLESEYCAYRRSHTEIFKMNGPVGGEFTFTFQGCEVSAWEEEKCSVPVVAVRLL